jgi:hypothetical protein
MARPSANFASSSANSATGGFLLRGSYDPRNLRWSSLWISNIRRLTGQRVFAKRSEGAEPEGEDQLIGARQREITSGATISFYDLEGGAEEKVSPRRSGSAQAHPGAAMA